MNYKKPQIVARSEAKKSYVAGCPTVKFWGTNDISGKRDLGCKKCEIAGR